MMNEIDAKIDTHATVGITTYNTILQDVIHGRLEAGKKLKLNELKTTYNASISTLREVLNRLINDGLIIAEEQKGFSVAPLTQKNLDELIYLRHLLESNMLTLSIQSGDIEWESTIISKHHVLNKYEQILIDDENSDSYNFCKADFEFHKAILSACDHEELISLHKIIYSKYLRYEISVLGFRGAIAMEEHKEILQHCLDRNVSDALRVLKKHTYETSHLFVGG